MNGGLALALEDTVSWRRPAQESCLPSPDDPAPPVAGPAADTEAIARQQQDDAALAEGCRSGSIGAYEQLYLTQGGRMKSIAWHLLGNEHDAEDVVQEVFLKVFRGVRYFRGQSSFSTWVYRILLNSCYDVRRKRLRRQEVAEHEHESEQPAAEPPAPENDHPLRMALESSVAQLSRQQREIFLLFEVEGFKHSEIAAMLGITETSSKNALYQAKRNLRRMLSASQRPMRLELP